MFCRESYNFNVVIPLCCSKQSSLWSEGDVFREKMNEQENGKLAVTRILSGVDDITINGSNNSKMSKKEEAELVRALEILSGYFDVKKLNKP